MTFNYNGKFTTAQNKLYEKGNRAIFALLRKSRQLHLPIDVQLHLFDALVESVLLYGCEVWAHEAINVVEKLHFRFCKYILSVNMSTCTNMVLGELGVTPLLLDAQCRMVMVWVNLSKPCNTSKLSTLLFGVLFKLYNASIITSPWIRAIKEIVKGCGFPGIWESRVISCSLECFKLKVKQNLKDQFFQKWSSQVDQSSKCLNYIIFKSFLKLEQYLTILPYCQRVWMTRFRCRNHKLPIGAGCRHGVLRENRICTHCNIEVGDEFHYMYLFKCSHFNDTQKRLLNCFYSRAPSSLKFELLMNVQNEVE